MSKTYHHGDKAKTVRFDKLPWGEYHRSTVVWDKLTREWRRVDRPKRKRSEDDWRWMRTPGHWIHDMMEVPHRAQVRQLLERTLKLHDVEDAPLFPLAKKPHVYYW